MNDYSCAKLWGMGRFLTLLPATTWSLCFISPRLLSNLNTNGRCGSGLAHAQQDSETDYRRNNEARPHPAICPFWATRRGPWFIMR